MLKKGYVLLSTVLFVPVLMLVAGVVALVKIKPVLKTVTIILLVAVVLQTRGFIPAALGASLEEGYRDMNNSHWSYDTVLWGQYHGIITGYPDGTFRPNTHVKESEFLAMLLRSLSGDVSIESLSRPEVIARDGHWAANYYAFAAQQNYPTSNREALITRTQVAELIVGTQGQNYQGADAIQYMLGHGLAKGRTSATVEGYKGNDRLTRAEAVQFIRNVLETVENPQLLLRPRVPSDPKDLPKLPEPLENPVATPKEQMRDAVRTEFRGEPYQVEAARNETCNCVMIDDQQGNRLVSYGDYRETSGTRVTTFHGKGVDNIEIVMRLWKALGIDVDGRLSEALIHVIQTNSQKQEHLAYDGFTATVMAGGLIIQFTEVE